MACPSTTTTAVHSSSSATISAVHADILQTYILTRLDGPALASTSCASSEFNSLCREQTLWSNICFSTWPSTNTPSVRRIISSFPNGARSFFSSSFPLTVNHSVTASANTTPSPVELISAVDIYYKNELIFSRVVETETESSWFKCSPFRVDLLDPKNTCQTMIRQPRNEDDHIQLADDLKLSWIIIDPAGKRALNVSSYKPVLVQTHWLSGELHARFGSVLAGESKKSAREFVKCEILVTCGGGTQGGGMHVREVSLQIEDMDGMYLNGKDSLGILHGSFEGKKGIKGIIENEGKKRYERFLEMKKERKDRKLKMESTLDVLCVIFGVLVFSSFGLLVLLR